MPIAGLSDRRRFSRGGKIRLGEKRENAKGKEYPAKIDYFKFDPDDESLIPKFHALFGDAPKEITIAFPSEDVEDIAPQYMKCYGKSGLICKGDGRRANRWTDGQMVEVECTPDAASCDFAMERGQFGKPGCKPTMNLQFFIPDLPCMYTFQIDTSSNNSIVAINSGIDILRRVAGRISFVPIQLRLVPRETTNPDDGKKITIYHLDLRIPVGLRDINQLQPLIANAAQAAALLEAPPVSEATPDDIVPLSQLAPDLTPSAPAQASLAEDPDIDAAFEASGFTPRKRDAMLASAEKDGWTKKQLLDAIGASAKPKSKPEPVEATAVAADDGLNF